MTTDPMLLYAKGTLDWAPSSNSGECECLIAEAYEGEYLIVPLEHGYALHRGQFGKWVRIGEGKTIEEVKQVAQVTAERNNDVRKHWYPKEWEESHRRITA
jgi:hypothetical protein